MAEIPTVYVVNNVEGTGWPVSGAGPGNGYIPGTKLSGLNASTSATSSSCTIDLSADNPDLSSVTTDRTSAIVLYDPATGSYYYAVITSVDNVAKTVTSSEPGEYWTKEYFNVPDALTGLEWAIGGKVDSLDYDWLWTAANGYTETASEIHVETTGIDYTLSKGRKLIGIVRGVGGRPRVVVSSDVYVAMLSRGCVDNLEIVGPGRGVSTQPCFKSDYGNSGFVSRCKISGFKYALNTGYTGNYAAPLAAIDCEIHDCDGVMTGNGGMATVGCYIHDCGWVMQSDTQGTGNIVRCILERCGDSGAVFYATQNSSPGVVADSVIYDSLGSIIWVGHSTNRWVAEMFFNCIVYKGSAYLYKFDNNEVTFVPCPKFGNRRLAWGAMTSGKSNYPTRVPDPLDPNDEIVLTQDPFVDAANGNFALNDYGKSVLQGAGWPQTWPGLPNTTSYPDIGAVESQAGSGGGSGDTLQGLPFARVFGGM